MSTIAFLLTLLLSTTHAIGYKLTFLHKTPRSRWLSFGGGISVAYVFIHLMPELSHGQSLIEESNINFTQFIRHHLYLVSLVGLVFFYCLESMVKRKSFKRTSKSSESEVFWIHILSFGFYNILIGYLMVHRDAEGLINLVLFSLAMVFHFIVNDFGILQHHKQIYINKGRWVLSTTVIAGYLLGRMTEISEVALMVIFAFIAGSIILNVLKEELPEERESRIGAFLAGALSYAALLLFIE